MLVRKSYLLLFYLIGLRCWVLSKNNTIIVASGPNHRYLSDTNAKTEPCDDVTSYKRYFNAIDTIYSQDKQHGTCIPVHKQCGWPTISQNPHVTEKQKSLPLLVLSVGLEGAGHHLWTEILDSPVFDCVWINGRHYQRDVGDGVPRTSAYTLAEGFSDMFRIRKENGKQPCKSIYDAEDSFPTGALRKSGRIFMRPDLISLQQLDGVLFNIKYLIIVRNSTDTALSALRRNFFTNIDAALRTVEHTLTYIESALRGIPCDRLFIAHYEHVLADPGAYRNPLIQFLELGSSQRDVLNSRLSKKGRVPPRKMHKLTQYNECRSRNLGEQKCYEYVEALIDDFLRTREFMWPTFAGNGYDFKIDISSG